jgi:hypothetical protein
MVRTLGQKNCLNIVYEFFNVFFFKKKNVLDFFPRLGRKLKFVQI